MHTHAHTLTRTHTHTHTPGRLPTSVLNEHHQVPPHCKKEYERVLLKFTVNLLTFTDIYWDVLYLSTALVMGVGWQKNS